MNNTVRVLLPVFPCDLKELYFTGYVDISDDYIITIYITKYASSHTILSKKQKDWENAVYGYFGHCFPKKQISNYHNFLSVENRSRLQINKLIIHGSQIKSTNNCIIMLYDYANIRDSQAICVSSNDYFSKLVNMIQDEHGQSTTKDYKLNFSNTSWVGSSMFLQHIFNYWRLIKWLITTVKRDKNVSIKPGNLMLAIVMDFVLGYVALQFLPQNKKASMNMPLSILSTIFGACGTICLVLKEGCPLSIDTLANRGQRLIHLLYSLLKWLMGAPVGLKLNNAFNKMLGKYFSYHVQLWWLFLDVSGEKLDLILHVYNYIGYLGFTFQTAIISDLICIATFHSYCIYVYAARLFNIQVSGLIALLRLFVGRKYNPLRGGIDSCEYTNQELFVGTVAFTILLLLLPTTTLYYIVFTMFRVLSLVVQYMLAKLIYMIQASPLYVIFLWLRRSPKIRGNILIEVLNKEENSPLVLRIKLFNKSIPELVKLFQPPVDIPKQSEWTDLLSNVLIGKQIV